MRINEFVTEHAPVEEWPGAPADLDAGYPDWIELYNPTGNGTVSLTGWCLSDDPLVLNKWTFPAGISMAANSYKIVFASGMDRQNTSKPSTNFKLKSEGVLILSKPDGAGGYTIVSQVGTAASPYPTQQIFFSYGCVDNTASPAYGYLSTSTPGAANNIASAVSDFCAKPAFSVHRGYYDAPFTLQITTDTIGSTIVYTLNGSTPTATNGTQVLPPNSSTPPTASINITQSTVIRARVIKTGLGNSDSITNTYIYWNDVLNQTGPLASMGLTAAQIANWGSSGQNIRSPAGPDWAVDPNITGESADPASRFTYDDLKNAPSVSLVTNFRDMFGPSDVGVSPKNGGIYIGPEVGVATEGDDREATFEYFNPDGSSSDPNAKSGFQAHGKVHVFGGTSDGRWKSYKLSLHFKADDTEKYNIYGDGTEDEQQDFVLDAQSNNSWDHPDALQRTRGEYVRDQVTADLQNQMGGWSQHGRPVHLFIEGMYWGMYILHEQPDEHFEESYQGGDSDDWDIFKHGYSTGSIGDFVNSGVIDSTKALSATNSTVNANYEVLMDLLGIGKVAPNPTPDLTQQASYEAVWTKLDRDAFIKYMALNFYAANNDWSQHNFYASYNRADPAGKWRFQSWDAEHVFETATDNILTKTSFTDDSPEDINAQLRNVPEYRLAFADVIQKLMFNNGVLSVANVTATFTNRFNQTDSAIRGESARWGDNRRTPAYTRGVEWLAETNRILNTVVPQKWTNMLANFRAANLYPSNTGANPVVTPDYRDNATDTTQYGGAVPAGFTLKLNNGNTGGAGTVYYTTDGTDPRVYWTGAVSPTAQTYTAPFLLGSPTQVKARLLNGTVWSALADAYFLVDSEPASAANLTITKIQYHPASPSAAETAAGYTDDGFFEFIELMNVGTKSIDLSGIVFSKGIDFTFLDSMPGRILAPGQRVLIVKNLAAFQFRYGTGLLVAGVFASGSLDNSGERLQLLAKNGSVIQDFTYDDSAPWPTAPDGSGPALVSIRPKTNPSLGDAASWRSSTSANGSPGADDRIVYSDWKNSSFTAGEAANASISGPDADPDGDGASNLVEYARGTDPKSWDAAAFAPVTIESVSGQNYGVVRYRYRLAAEDAVLTPQTSTDLATWTATGLVSLSTAHQADGSFITAWRLSTPASQDAARFLRVKAVYQP